MQQFRLEFQTLRALKDQVASFLATGNAFLATERPFSLNQEFLLCVKVVSEERAILFPVRVIQTLSVPNKGMVIEFLRSEQYKRETLDLLNAERGKDWQGVRDFAQSQTGRSLKPAEGENFLERLHAVTEKLAQRNYYELLGIGFEATQKDVSAAFDKRIADFFSRPIPTQAKESVELLEAFRKRLGEAYEHLSDPKKRRLYEFKLGKVVRHRDESLNDFKQKQIEFAKHLVRLKNRANVEKAERVYESVKEALQQNNLPEALNQMRLCVAFDPLNEAYQQELKELELKAEANKEPESQNKMEKLLNREREMLKGKKMDWRDES